MARLLLLSGLLCAPVATNGQMVPVSGVDGAAPGGGAPLYATADGPSRGTAPAASGTAAGDTAAAESDESSSSPAAEGGGLTRPLPRPQDLRRAAPREGYRMRPFRAVAFGLTASTLGGGAEMAVPVSRRVNLRIGGSYIRYDVPFDIDAVNYDPGVKFTSARSTLDWFPHGGAFHVSVGALYFQNTIHGVASVGEGRTFKLGEDHYLNSVDDPIRGSASIVYHKKTAPMATLGFGNILPRSGRHLSVPFEFGGAYLQPPDVLLDLQGTACTDQGCFDARTNGQLRDDLETERIRFQKDLRPFQVYPIVSLGLACRF